MNNLQKSTRDIDLAEKFAKIRSMCRLLGAEIYSEYEDILPGFTKHFANPVDDDNWRFVIHHRGLDKVSVDLVDDGYSPFASVGGDLFTINTYHPTPREAIQALLSRHPRILGSSGN